MAFKNETVDNAFNHWMGISTWHTLHPSDMKRFHMFINEVVNSNEEIDYDRIKEEIISAADSKLNKEFVNEKADVFASIADHIIDYYYDIRNP